MFLEHQIIILESFLKDRVTEDWSNDAENSALHHRNKLDFKMCIQYKENVILVIHDITQ